MNKYAVAMAAFIIAIIAAGVTALTIALLILEIADTTIIVSGVISMLIAFYAGDFSARRFVLANRP